MNNYHHKNLKFLKYVKDNSVSYGKPYRAHTPMKSLMSNIYGQQAEDSIKSRYEFHSQQVELNVLTDRGKRK